MTANGKIAIGPKSAARARRRFTVLPEYQSTKKEKVLVLSFARQRSLRVKAAG